MAAMSTPPEGDGAARPHPPHLHLHPAHEASRKRWTLISVCIATFMLLLDITVVNVALPDIQKELDASFSDLQWVIDAYALSLAALLLAWGSASDLIGRKRVFMIGLAVFTGSSLLCGLAHSATWLILARGLQGVGGAAMFATSLAILAATFEGRERGNAIGIWGATTGAAVAIGPLVGGWLTESFGWEWIFIVNVPIGLMALVVSARYLHESRNPQARRIDVPGVITLSTGLLLLVFGLVRGNAEGWGSPQIVASLAGAVVLLVSFFVIEGRVPEAMVDLALFRNHSFSGAAIVAFAISAAMFSMFLYLTLYMQNGLGYSPLQAGVRFLPITLLSFFVAPASGRLSSRVEPRVLMGSGLLLVGVGLLLMRGLTPQSSWTALLPGFIVCGIGIGLTTPALASTAVGVVDPRRSGMAAGVNNTFRQVGIAVGTAGLGAIFENVAADALPAGFSATGGGQPIAGATDALRTQVLGAYTDALNTTLLVAAIVALLGAAAAVALVRRRDFVPLSAPPAPAAG